jgi:CO dehydrogenase maturation factor
MTTTIAIAGKGGTGKTTLAGLIVRRLTHERAGPILAIDADPASNLHSVLDLPLEKTVGDVREETSEQARANLLEAGVAKRDILEYRINSSVVEGVGVDLLAMGRPEGPGCYCAANSMLRAIIDAIAGSYEWVLIDNEAGLEHLSRRTTRDVDLLLIVSDPTVRGITTAGRIAAVLEELDTKVGRHYLVVNQAGGELTPQLREAVAQQGLELLALLPDDPLVAAFDAAGRPLADLPEDSPMSVAVQTIMDVVLNASQEKETAGAHHR